MIAPHLARFSPWRAWTGSRSGIVLLLVAGVIATVLQFNNYQIQRRTTAQEQADILAATVPAAVAFRDEAAATEYVRSMMVNPEIEAAGIYTADRQMMAAITSPSSKPLPQVLAALRPSNDRGVIAQIRQRDEALGWVYLRLSPEPLLHQLERYGGLAILGAMAVIVVITLGRAHRELTRQSARLAEANELLKREMAERAQMEEALRQGQKLEAIGQLAGGIAHDLNNHLAIIRGNLGLLQQKLAVPADDRHYQRAIEGVDRAASLTRRVLGFSRQQPLNPVEIDVNELISGMMELIHSSLRANIEVKLDLGCGDHVWADRTQFENVILNLLVNARDAMPEGGTVAICTQARVVKEGGASPSGLRPGQYVALKVADNGVGMSPEIREKARDPYFTTKPFGEGTGLGLSMAASFASQSGGGLGLDSEPKKGTTVAIYLPKYVGAGQGGAA